MVVWCCCCYWRADSETSVLNEGVLRKRRCLADFPSLCCPERWSGMNGISHPDWVKLCVDPNGRIKLRAKQKYEILSATLFLIIIIVIADIHNFLKLPNFFCLSCKIWIVLKTSLLWSWKQVFMLQVLGRNSQTETVSSSVNNWFEFIVFLLDRLTYNV